jgi:VanZ family protein
VSEPRSSGQKLRPWLPALFLMALIFVLSSQSGLRVSEDASIDGPLRTLAHFVVYASLAAALALAIGGTTRASARSAGIAFVLAVLYGLSDEVHQAFVPDRTGALDDLAVDALGALVGVSLVYVWLRRR